MRSVLPAEARRHRDELVWRVARAADAADVFAEAAPRLRRLVDFDAAAWLSLDPTTALPAGPTRIDALEGITYAQCSEHWRSEFLVDDVNRFVELARARRPAATLRSASPTPADSPRYRRFLRPMGFHDELRAVLRAGGRPWGTLTLWRREGEPAFSERDTDLVAGLSAPLADALRAAARPTDGAGGSDHPERPGLLLFDAGGELVSANDAALAWLEELPADPRLHTDLGVDVPMWLAIVVLRAGAHGRTSSSSPPPAAGTARVRLRSRRGPWVVCDASCLVGTDGTPQGTAVVVEPANPAETAPILVEAYELSAREQEITRLIARGAGTAEIARRLHLSPHTVRDHVKAIFQKVEVASRGELVAKLFAEHYETGHADGLVRAPRRA
jgi:DNA-binding CsgD family transcriptional regulator